MSVWGIGANYKNTKNSDKTDAFITGNMAYIGWSKKDAPAIHNMFNSIKLGDIIYIKSFSQRSKTLQIKAVGIVNNTEKITSSLGTGISVNWKNNFTPFTIDITNQMYKNNVFNNSLYEEYNENVILKIVENLLS